MKKVAGTLKTLKKRTSFKGLENVLDELEEQGKGIPDLLLLVSKDVIHSGYFPTRYGSIEMVSDRTIHTGRFILMDRSDYIGSLR